MRPTSSTRSCSIVTSLVARALGTAISSAPAWPFTPKPSRWRMSAIFESLTSAPSSARTRSVRNEIVFAGSFQSPTSVIGAGMESDGSSDFNVRTKCAAAFSGSVGSRLFSNRADESVRSARRCDVRRTVAGWNAATSSRSWRVSPCTCDPSPPITPASATGTSPLQMSMSLGCSLRSIPSSVFIDSPARALRTRMPSGLSRERSNTWFGCPRSSITKFETSTSRSIGRCPTANNNARNQSGDRRADDAVDRHRDVARAAARFDAHGERFAVAALRHLELERLQRAQVHRRDLARDAADVPTDRTVRERLVVDRDDPVVE
jgi:hypothetical protein